MTAEQCLENSCFGYIVNMGDTFAYACADFEMMSDYDWELIKPIVEDFGYDGFNAYAAVKRDRDVINPKQTPNYWKAKAKIEDILKDDIMFMDGDELCVPIRRWRDPNNPARTARQETNLV